MTYRRMSKLERLIQRFRNWCYETTDAKLVTAAFVFVAAVLFWFERIAK